MTHPPCQNLSATSRSAKLEWITARTNDVKRWTVFGRESASSTTNPTVDLHCNLANKHVPYWFPICKDLCIILSCDIDSI